MIYRSLIDSAYSFRSKKTDTPFVMVRKLKIQRRKSKLISSGNQSIGVWRKAREKEEEYRHVDAASIFKTYLMLPQREMFDQAMRKKNYTCLNAK